MIFRPPRLLPLCIVAGSLLLFFGIVFPLAARARENARRTSCACNLKQIGMAIAQYRLDNDAFPRVAWNPAPKTAREYPTPGPAYGWADGLQPYLKSVSLFNCPSNAAPYSADMLPEHKGYTDYWMNARLSSLSAASPNTFLLGDGDGYGTSRASRSSFPRNWESMPANSWFWRHQGGANYLFADSHIKWLRPEEVDGKNAKFAP